MLFQNGERVVYTGDSATDFDRKRPVGEGLGEGMCGEDLMNISNTVILTILHGTEYTPIR